MTSVVALSVAVKDIEQEKVSRKDTMKKFFALWREKKGDTSTCSYFNMLSRIVAVKECDARKAS